MDPCQSLSPLDGRYRDTVADIRNYFSEAALIKYRIKVEVKYLLMLNRFNVLPRKLTDDEQLRLTNLYINFNIKYAHAVKEFEKETHHDVKAVEYFIRQHCPEDLHSMIHFALTSEDINSTSYMLMFMDFIEGCYYSVVNHLVESINTLAYDCNVPMLALTHGQPAVTTTMAKELQVFTTRINYLMREQSKLPYQNKFGGAVGTLAGHYQTFPDVDWLLLIKRFHSKMGLERIDNTTQVNNYDNLACHLNYIKQVNTILIDFARDIWSYVSRNLFKQSVAIGQVGSSTMPQKINPINFENAEGNLQLSNAILTCLTDHLPVSRMQRDLSGSTQIRNLGTALGYSILAYKSLISGLKKLSLNKETICRELQSHLFSIIMEPIQLVLRKHNISNAYEICRDFAHKHQNISAQQFADWIDSLEVSEATKTELSKIDMNKYLGNTS